MVKTCRWCGNPLSGAQTHYDSATCKAKQNAFDHSMDRLAELPEIELREILRGVFVKRWGLYGKTRRFHLRFGEYQESGESPASRILRLATWREVDPEVKRVGARHVWHGSTPRRLSWIAQLLRKLDRASLLSKRERKERS